MGVHFSGRLFLWNAQKQRMIRGMRHGVRQLYETWGLLQDSCKKAVWNNITHAARGHARPNNAWFILWNAAAPMEFGNRRDVHLRLCLTFTRPAFTPQGSANFTPPAFTPPGREGTHFTSQSNVYPRGLCQSQCVLVLGSLGPWVPRPIVPVILFPDPSCSDPQGQSQSKMTQAKAKTSRHKRKQNQAGISESRSKHKQSKGHKQKQK